MADTTKKTNAELEELQEAARQRVAQEAEQAATLRTQQDAAELAALNTTQGEEMSALKSNNQALYKNQQEIIDAAYAKIETAKQKDEKARRRENAFRYISGLGDTLSGVANLIGTAHGAANQQQTYNSHAVVQKAEEARKARKLEMDDLSKRYDEMKSRLNELQAAGSLKEAQLAASHAKAVAALNKTHRTAADEAQKYADTQAYREVRAVTEDWQKNRNFDAQQEQTKQAQENWQKTYNMQYAKFKDEQNAKNYNFTFADGSIDIPKDKLNEVNVERIFQMLPDDIKKSIKGEQTTIYETDEFGNSVRKTGNKAPTLAQKLAALGAYADKDENIRNELKRLVPPKGKSGRDWSNREE